MSDETSTCEDSVPNVVVYQQDIRTRIAAVQRDHRLVTRMVGRKAEKSCLCGWRSPKRDCTFTDHPEHMADAVIRELDAMGIIHLSKVRHDNGG